MTVDIDKLIHALELDCKMAEEKRTEAAMVADHLEEFFGISVNTEDQYYRGIHDHAHMLILELKRLKGVHGE